MPQAARWPAHSLPCGHPLGVAHSRATALNGPVAACVPAPSPRSLQAARVPGSCWAAVTRRGQPALSSPFRLTSGSSGQSGSPGLFQVALGPARGADAQTRSTLPPPCLPVLGHSDLFLAAGRSPPSEHTGQMPPGWPRARDGRCWGPGGFLSCRHPPKRTGPAAAAFPSGGASSVLHSHFLSSPSTRWDLPPSAYPFVFLGECVYRAAQDLFLHEPEQMLRNAFPPSGRELGCTLRSQMPREAASWDLQEARR